MAALPCCTEGTWKRSAAPRVDRPVYPRRAEHNTVAEGGNRRWAETARLPAKLSGACALHPASSGGYEPENGVAVALPRSAHGPLLTQTLARFGYCSPEEPSSAWANHATRYGGESVNLGDPKERLLIVAIARGVATLGCALVERAENT